ncbi:hypothetical protein OSTOST_04195 [Ostertagia ostertagi]
MDTPVSHLIKSGKRPRVVTPDGPMLSPDFVDIVKQVNDSKAVPECVKKWLLSISTQLSAIIEENVALRKRLEAFNDLEKENKQLKDRLRFFEQKEVSHPLSADPTPAKALPYEEIERRRSIVISGVPELHDGSCFDRMHYDYQSTLNILSHLDVDCYPVAVYRLGRWFRGKNRLIKVVLPCSLYQRIAVRRAPRLRTFPERGVFLRESLTLEERVRRRESRFARSRNVDIHHDSAAVSVPPPPTSDNCAVHCSPRDVSENVAQTSIILAFLPVLEGDVNFSTATAYALQLTEKECSGFLDRSHMARGSQRKTSDTGNDKEIPLWASMMMDQYVSCADRLEKALTSSLAKLVDKIDEVNARQNEILSRIAALEDCVSALQRSSPVDQKILYSTIVKARADEQKFGVFGHVSIPNKNCSVTFQFLTKTAEEAREFCEGNAPYYVKDFKSGKPTKCLYVNEVETNVNLRPRDISTMITL